jgi:NAD(P)-dependent dehydrogenase (short-subunit alcohol dehydrogenase family)
MCCARDAPDEVRRGVADSLRDRALQTRNVFADSVAEWILAALPGGISTATKLEQPRTERTQASAEKELAANVSIGRIVDSKEVAYVVAFLASPRSVAINGDAIPVGGGSVGAIYY